MGKGGEGRYREREGEEISPSRMRERWRGREVMKGIERFGRERESERMDMRGLVRNFPPPPYARARTRGREEEDIETLQSEL